MMAENETGTVMLPPAKTQEAFVHIGFAEAKIARGRAFALAILAGAFVAPGNIVGGAAVAAAYWFVYGRDVRE